MGDSSIKPTNPNAFITCQFISSELSKPVGALSHFHQCLINFCSGLSLFFGTVRSDYLSERRGEEVWRDRLRDRLKVQLGWATLYHRTDPGILRYHRQSSVCLICYRSQIWALPAKSQYPTDWSLSALPLKHPLKWKGNGRKKSYHT